MYLKIYIYFFFVFLMNFMLSILWMNLSLYMSIFLEFKFLYFINTKMGLLMMIDLNSIMFFQTIFLITGMVYYFSNFYMDFSKNFMILLMMFFFSMIILIFSVNLFSLLLGWDGLGITSFLLINYYKNFYSAMASLSTFFITRSGDLIIILAMVMNLSSTNSFKNFFSSKMMIFLMILAFLTKSAQYPFISWLPMAMSAPTPISSLVHSSTLVTAGIYEILRFEILLNKKIFLIFLFISILTMMTASMFAMAEMDFKKMVAMSTLSQMGLMSMMIFMNEKEYCMFHLLSHALFKSFLFMKVGSMMKFNNGEQDMRLIEINKNNYPSYFIMGLVTCLSMMGTPFLSGFFMKDFLFNSMMKFDQSFFMIVTFFISSLMTITYSMKILKEMWFEDSKGSNFKFEKLDKNFKKFFFFIAFKMISMGLYMEMIMELEDVFLMFSRDKIYLLNVYSMSMMCFWFIYDLTKIFKNIFCSMMFMEFWSFKFFFKKMNTSKKNFLENSWGENVNKILKMIFKKTYLMEIFSIPLFIMISMNIFMC